MTAYYSVLASGWVETPESQEPAQVGTVRITLQNMEYSFEPIGAWEDEQFLPAVLSNTLVGVDESAVWESLPKGQYNWWFARLQQCVIEACNKNFPDNLSRYQ